jgi:hypothetical protein
MNGDASTADNFNYQLDTKQAQNLQMTPKKQQATSAGSNREARRAAERGKQVSPDVHKPMVRKLKASTEVDITGLSKLFEEINNIDWKDTLNG